jgi:hypothetical protein
MSLGEKPPKKLGAAPPQANGSKPHAFSLLLTNPTRIAMDGVRRDEPRVSKLPFPTGLPFFDLQPAILCS